MTIEEKIHRQKIQVDVMKIGLNYAESELIMLETKLPKENNRSPFMKWINGQYGLLGSMGSVGHGRMRGWNAGITWISKKLQELREEGEDNRENLWDIIHEGIEK